MDSEKTKQEEAVDAAMKHLGLDGSDAVVVLGCFYEDAFAAGRDSGHEERLRIRMEGAVLAAIAGGKPVAKAIEVGKQYVEFAKGLEES